MALEISVVNDEVLPLDPAVIAQAFLKHFVDRQNPDAAKRADAARRPLRTRTPWANEQRRNTRYELPPLHSILTSTKETGQNFRFRP
jgi:hypothetical protein